MWFLIYLFNVSIALILQLVINLSTKAVTTVLSTFFVIRNLPTKTIIDIAKNVSKSRKLIFESFHAGFSKEDLKEIQATWPQIKWTIIPSDTPHWIKGAEAMVEATRRSPYYLSISSLTLLEFDAAIKNIASTINNHHLDFNVSEDAALTPN